MKWLTVILILTMILIAGCIQNTDESIVCNSPYIRYGTDCCLDRNSNSVCDSDETQNVITKPTIYCKYNKSLCQEILSNCTDSVLIEEQQVGIDMVTFNITKKDQICNFSYNVNKYNTRPEIENTSMICNYPIVNGKTAINENNNISEHCEGSLLDKLSALNPPSDFIGPTARGFTQINVIYPWELDSYGNLKLQLENRVGQNIVINGIKANTGTTAITPCTSASLPSEAIAPGAKYPASGLMTLSCPGTAGTAGSSYEITVKIDYTVFGNLFSQTGRLSGVRSD